MVWTGRIEGKALGLSWHGSLFVSTDSGYIHCFRHTVEGESKMIAEEARPSRLPRTSWPGGIGRRRTTSCARFPRRRGYCLVLDCGQGRLACELAQRSELKIVAIDADADAADEGPEIAGLRRLLRPGHRASLTDRAGCLSRATSPTWWSRMACFAAAGVPGNPRGGDASPASLRRRTPPGVRCGRRGTGTTVGAKPSASQWQVARRDDLRVGPAPERSGLDGSGQWTHQYAEPGNSACSGDRLVKGPLTVQWFGEPGRVT